MRWTPHCITGPSGRKLRFSVSRVQAERPSLTTDARSRSSWCWRCLPLLAGARRALATEAPRTSLVVPRGCSRETLSATECPLTRPVMRRWSPSCMTPLIPRHAGASLCGRAGRKARLVCSMKRCRLADRFTDAFLLFLRHSLRQTLRAPEARTRCLGAGLASGGALRGLLSPARRAEERRRVSKQTMTAIQPARAGSPARSGSARTWLPACA
jgi:hypothetical protein